MASAQISIFDPTNVANLWCNFKEISMTPMIPLSMGYCRFLGAFALKWFLNEKEIT